MSAIAPPPTTSLPSDKRVFCVAVIDGGIAGACAASVLRSASSLSENKNENEILPAARRGREGGEGSLLPLRIDLFDQSRSGVGGRTSHRRTTLASTSDSSTGNGALRFNHSCQFFWADTPRF